MKKLVFTLTMFHFALNFISAQEIKFDDYFINQSLRIDLTHAGNIENSVFYLEDLKKEPFWGGSHKNLIDRFDYGEYKVEVYDAVSNKMIYSRNFTTLFQEWSATAEAKIVSKSFYETIIVPYPKNKIRVEIYERDKSKTKFNKKFDFEVNPQSYFISPERPGNYYSEKVVDNGDPKEKVDVVFIPDGYTNAEKDKFIKDVKKMTEYFFSSSPFKENKEKFNFWFVFAPSDESGTDFPKDGIYKRTVVNSSFSTFDVDRYCMTTDIKSVRDIAGFVPYDQIIILVNTNVYGGGGIYNYYCLTSSDNKYVDYVVVHEFGHAFAGLADEYYTSDVAVEDYYPLNVEPYEPNLTTLVNFDKKWKNMIDKDTPIPTPDEKKYYNTLGVFEGGGYIAKGVYRPMHDCTMKSILPNAFCPVCKKAIIDMINFYAE